jgi:transposase
VVDHYVAQGRARIDASDVTRIAIDETAARRGHDYITLFVDLDQARVLFATEGRDANTIAAFADDLAAHGGEPAAIEEVCIDMSPAFIKGVAENLPNAAITFDKFHAVKIINDAVDHYPIRLAFQDFYQQHTPEQAAAFLKQWYFWATHSRLPPITDAAHTVKRHWDGVLRWFDSKIANGLIEGINSLVQAAKAKARGYRSIRNLKAMIYLLAGKLDLRLPA